MRNSLFPKFDYFVVNLFAYLSSFVGINLQQNRLSSWSSGAYKASLAALTFIRRVPLKIGLFGKNYIFFAVHLIFFTVQNHP